MRRTILGIISLLLLAACTRPPGRASTGVAQPAAPQVIGHAGSGFFTPLRPFNPLPPSSLGGVLRALARGADGIEVDVQLSRDSVPMLFHDVDLSNRTARRGYISQYTAAELTQLRYRGGWPYDWFQRERLVTLDELLAELARRPTFPYLHLDLHEHDQAQPAAARYARSPALARALARSLRRYPVPPGRLLVLTEHLPSLPRLRASLPGVALGLEITDQFDERLTLAAAAGAEAVVLSKTVATPERVAQARTRGLQAVIFGGRSAGSIRRLLACRPDALEVDHVRLMRRLLRRGGADAGAPNAGRMR